MAPGMMAPLCNHWMAAKLPLTQSVSLMKVTLGSGLGSTTVTMAAQATKLPLASVAERMTVLTPMSEQVKVSRFKERLSMPQLSVLPLSIWDAVIVTLPLTPNCTVMSWQRVMGPRLSSTVTVAVQELLLPEESATVKVTVLGPMSTQVKLVWLKVLVKAQLSALPLSTALAEVLPLPEASSCTVSGWQTALGAMVSRTVTVALQVLVLPEPSDTVRVTLFVPRSAQKKVFWLRVRPVTAHPSLLPLSTALGLVLALPVASRYRVMFWQTAVGATVSRTVTVVLQALVFPLRSTMVRVTETLGTSMQVKVVWLATRVAMPQLSLLPPSRSSSRMLAVPLPSSSRVRGWQTAVAARLSCTVTTAVQELVLPEASATARVTVLLPMLEQKKRSWLSARVSIPQLSLEPLSIWALVMVATPAASRLTLMGWQTAFGGMISETMASAVQEAVLPEASVTVMVTLLLPRLAQVKVVWVAL